MKVPSLLPLTLLILLGEPIHGQETNQVESEFHNIYSQYYSDRTDDVTWRDLVGQKGSEVYRIRSGDNLWSISKVFFGDGFYWPKIWSLNDNIVNPHLIEPGNSIRFVLGDESEAPSFAITENDRPNKTTVSANRYDDIEIPPPSQEFKPVLRKIPKSLPAWQTSSGLRNEVDYNGANRHRTDPLSPIPVLITQSFPAVVGRVIEMETGGVAAHTNQTIYIESFGGNLEVGKMYSIVRNRGRLRTTSQMFDRMGTEILVEYQGRIKIEEKVESNRRSPNPIFRASVEQSILPISVGSEVSAAPLKFYHTSNFNGPESSVESKIIGGADSNQVAYFGINSIAFLNRGYEDGLQMGQVMPVRSNRVLRNERTAIRETNKPIGFLKIIDVQPRFATAVIYAQDSEIQMGDVTGRYNPRVASESTSGSQSKSDDDLDLDTN